MIEQDTLWEVEETWRELGACRDYESGMFFPEKEDVEAIARAKAVCASCTVQADCLAYAVETNQAEGIWGGTTPRERRRLRRRWLEQLRRAG